MEHGGEASVLDWVCRLTLFIAPALSIPGTYRAWRQRTLGVGGRRPEPTVAALICNLAWVMYGIQVAEHKWEPVSLNAWGALLQLLYLITFLALCAPQERDRVPVPMGYGCVYLCCTFFIGGLHADAFKWFCTAVGCVAATAPLLSIAFLTDEWTFAMLPYWGISAFSVVHGVLWLAGGFPMENDPKQTGPNYSMVAQNGFGTLCSLILPWVGPTPTYSRRLRTRMSGRQSPVPTSWKRQGRHRTRGSFLHHCRPSGPDAGEPPSASKLHRRSSPPPRKLHRRHSPPPRKLHRRHSPPSWKLHRRRSPPPPWKLHSRRSPPSRMLHSRRSPPPRMLHSRRSPSPRMLHSRRSPPSRDGGVVFKLSFKPRAATKSHRLHRPPAPAPAALTVTVT